MVRIDTKTGRDKLKSRREPYWRKLTQGRYLGFRKSDAGGSWIARYRTEDRKQRYLSLGEVSRIPYDQAVTSALTWFKALDEGVTGRTSDGSAPTVETACREYVADLEREGRQSTAHEVDMRFRRTVYGDESKYRPHAIASIKLSKIRAAHLKDWRSGLLKSGASKASANRNTAALKAALNLAVKARLVSIEKAREWHDLKRLKDAGIRRDLFLDRNQRRRLRDACEGAVRDLVEAAMLTRLPCRRTNQSPLQRL